MAVFFVVPVLAFFGSISGVFGQFVCDTSIATGTPKCKLSTADSCDKNECCTNPPASVSCRSTVGTPSTTSADAAARKLRCTTNKMFAAATQYQKQLELGTAGDADYVTKCCVDCTAAKCSDWPLYDSSTFACAVGTVPSETDPVLASASACVAPTAVLYKSTCCVVTCDSKVGIQTAKNTICGVATENEYKYFVANPQAPYGSIVVASDSDTDFKSTCCTLCTTITCSNLVLMYNTLTCTGTDVTLKSTTVYTSLVNCAKPTDEAFRLACCGTKCSVGTGPAKKTKCGSTKIVDLDKKNNYPADATDEKYKTDCCKDCAATLCKEWTAPYYTMFSCATGVFHGKTVLAGAANCAEPTAEAKKVCCATQMLCSAWVADASAALPTCFPFIGTLLASLAVMLGVDCL